MSALQAVAICVATLSVAAAARSPQGDRSYRDIVAKYHAGEYDNAVKELAALSHSKLEDERRNLERTPPFGSLDGSHVKAAIMLHTEAHFGSASGDLPYLPSPHLDRARRLVRRCLELIDAPLPANLDRTERVARYALEISNGREFARQWYLLIASQFQGKRHISRSAHYLQDARFHFPDDPDVLLASGSHHEMLTFVPTGRFSAFDASGARMRDEVIDYAKERSEAARYFRAALGANPALDEAQLRLGRTLYLLGDLPSAATELDAVRTRARHEIFKSLAALFQALVEEEGGRRSRAAELYVEAMKLVPEAQTSYLGLSELLYMDGQPDRAANLILDLLERPAPRDPWWMYMTGEWWHFDARLRLLRTQARQ
jgi:tetratricopeptide (TPR) repeat protein